MQHQRSFKLDTPVHKDKRVNALNPLDACKKVAPIVFKKVKGKVPFDMVLTETTRGSGKKVYGYKVDVKQTGKLTFKAIKQQTEKKPPKKQRTQTGGGEDDKTLTVDLCVNADGRVSLDLNVITALVDELDAPLRAKIVQQIEAAYRATLAVHKYLVENQSNAIAIDTFGCKFDANNQLENESKLTVNQLTLDTFKQQLLTLQSKVDLNKIVSNGTVITNIDNNASITIPVKPPGGPESHLTVNSSIQPTHCKFVIVTYYWGQVPNRNLQYPCPEDEKLSPEAIDDYYGEGYNEMIQCRKKAPITYPEMIKYWAERCAEVGCYFYCEYYKDFESPGMYQLAINAKPLFIEKALNACKQRMSNDFTGVVYIDGDMTVNCFPSIFNMPNIDFMARGWNYDPRSSAREFRRGQYSFDPYVFETSGGIMFFGDTTPARLLLRLWHSISSNPKFQGKADDRILSMIVTKYMMQAVFNIVQLPIEYLWLTDMYGEKKFDAQFKAPETTKQIYDKGFKPGDVVGRSGSEPDISGPIIFEHPGCLTGEERAADQGAAQDRSPDGYDFFVTRYINDHEHGGIFYKHVMFDGLDENAHERTLNAVDSINFTCDSLSDLQTSKVIVRENRSDKELAMASYATFLTQMANLNKDNDQDPPFYVSDDYGELTSVVIKNTNDKNNVKQRILRTGGNTHGPTCNAGQKLVKVIEGDDIPQILFELENGYDVIVKPKTINSKVYSKNMEILRNFSKTDIELACFARLPHAASKIAKFEYKMDYDPTLPIFLSHKSTTLRHLLSMSKSIFSKSKIEVERPNGRRKVIDTTLSAIFNSSHVFLSKIRCVWLDRNQRYETDLTTAKALINFNKHVTQFKTKVSDDRKLLRATKTVIEYKKKKTMKDLPNTVVEGQNEGYNSTSNNNT